jgi:hypothetical protein
LFGIERLPRRTIGDAKEALARLKDVPAATRADTREAAD